jgi:hypothetical protein
MTAEVKKDTASPPVNEQVGVAVAGGAGGAAGGGGGGGQKFRLLSIQKNVWLTNSAPRLNLHHAALLNCDA